MSTLWPLRCAEHVDLQGLLRGEAAGAYALNDKHLTGSVLAGTEQLTSCHASEALQGSIL